MSESKQGLVIKSTGSWYKVESIEGELIDCQIKGKFRIKGLRTTNPLAVGDRVGFIMNEDGTGVIESIEARKNYIIRKSVNLSKEAHIVASNVDRAYLVVTLVKPPTSFGFIDRFLVTAEAYSIPVTILFNKLDVYDDEAYDKLDVYRSIYEAIGYECMEISALTGHGMDALRESMKSQINLLSGHSGVGKSTLINALIPGLDIKTSDISDAHNKGRHTTTFAEMHKMENGGYLVDTPGIKGFGLVDIPKEELHHYFPEFFERLSECKFHNCLHINEPGCAIKKSIEVGELSYERYQSYFMMFNNDESTSYR